VTQVQNELAKGEAAEEALRSYFLGLGFYAARGVPVLLEGVDVTDVDVWLYCRPSPLSRERSIVDIKRKKTPQALERIFWTKGLQSVLGLERAIVVTTDTRREVTEFGHRHDVIVLDGNFLSRLLKRDGGPPENRIHEEVLLGSAHEASLGKLGGDWKGRIVASKARLLEGLDFDSANRWLNDLQYFYEQLATAGSAKSTILRATYVLMSHFLVCVDYLSHRLSYLDHETRRNAFVVGFRYGESGLARAEQVLTTAKRLATVVAPLSSSGFEHVRKEILTGFEDIRAEVLADYFCQGKNQHGMFDAARAFEANAYTIEALAISSLSPQLASLIGLCCDFFGIDRKKLL